MTGTTASVLNNFGKDVQDDLANGGSLLQSIAPRKSARFRLGWSGPVLKLAEEKLLALAFLSSSGMLNLSQRSTWKTVGKHLSRPIACAGPHSRDHRPELPDTENNETKPIPQTEWNGRAASLFPNDSTVSHYTHTHVRRSKESAQVKQQARLQTSKIRPTPSLRAWGGLVRCLPIEQEANVMDWISGPAHCGASDELLTASEGELSTCTVEVSISNKSKQIPCDSRARPIAAQKHRGRSCMFSILSSIPVLALSLPLSLSLSPFLSLHHSLLLLSLTPDQVPPGVGFVWVRSIPDIGGGQSALGHFSISAASDRYRHSSLPSSLLPLPLFATLSSSIP